MGIKVNKMATPLPTMPKPAMPTFFSIVRPLVHLLANGFQPDGYPGLSTEKWVDKIRGCAVYTARSMMRLLSHDSCNLVEILVID